MTILLFYIRPAWAKVAQGNFSLGIRDVLKAIRNMEPAWEKINGTKFGLVNYKDAKGELSPC